MDLTRFVGKLFTLRLKELEAYDTKAEQLQEQVLGKLVRGAVDTQWGKQHAFSSIHHYTDFRKLPISDYEALKESIDRMRHGEADVLWKGHIKWFAKSSGTTNDKSKFIPVSKRGLHGIHYAGGFDCVAVYLGLNPRSRLFSGKGLILGGSHSPNYNLKNSLVGDLSAILIQNINPLANLVRVPTKKVALMSDFEQKVERIVSQTATANVTNLSGVPSWMLVVLKRLLEVTGKATVNEVWPNLEVFFHGGVSFTPYRIQYEQLISTSQMHYLETYNASEGFFGIQTDWNDPSMMLMIDYDVFYEFIPLEELDTPQPTVVPLWGIEVGRNYAMLISTSCGLWRYLIGDTVKFTQKNPYKFIITGRTKSFINAFGEELMVDNAEKGLEKACSTTGARIVDYTAAPVFMDKEGKCRHQWLIEFEKQPSNHTLFAEVLDDELKRINSDYEAKRYKNLTLQMPEVIPSRPGLFKDWLKMKGKLGGQYKVPRLCNTREHIDELLNLNKQ